MTRSRLAVAVIGVLAGCAFGCGDDDADPGPDGAGGSGDTGGMPSGNDGGSDASSGGDPGAPLGGSGTGSDTCPGDIIASWEVDGEPVESSSSTFVAAGATWSVTIVECTDDGVDATLVFSHLPVPVAVGTYALTSTLLHGAQTTADPGALYSADDASYFTNEEQSGELVITEVDDAANTFSGTFSFSAIDDDATKTIALQGTITAATFRP